ncbi:MAG: gamma-glutamylcyclotransferase [Pseudomonadales bacterium]|nr:gamma-glutamylcyclotransferase [Pseudomonadales bacterium]
MKYFAYGSNMSLSRLTDRVPSAERLGMFMLDKHDLRFHKTGKDGSGKCDAYQTNNSEDSVMGAVFEIKECEKTSLDRAEALGNGYDQKVVSVHNNAGDVVKAITYYATRIDPSLKPYSWYLNHVTVGARETHVPEQYLHNIQRIECIEDSDKKRDAKERAIHSSQDPAPTSSLYGRH